MVLCKVLYITKSLDVKEATRETPMFWGTKLEATFTGSHGVR
jgi:hypothetical protein